MTTQMVDPASGRLVDVPDDQVQQLYMSRTLGLPNGATIPIRRADGQVGTIDSADAAQAFSSGSSLVPQHEYEAAVRHEKYGGIGAGLAAGAAGVARGLTMGLSDPLATGAAGLFGGKEAEESTRSYLRDIKEEHPYASGAGELAGMAAPLLASGGAAAPLEAAEGARLLAGGAEAAPGLLGKAFSYTPAGLLNSAGNAAERAATGLVGAADTGSAIGNIARSAIKTGARGAAENSLFSAGNEVSEASLGDHELNAESLAAAVGHGAIAGAGIGAALGGVGKVAGEAVSKLASKIAPAAEEASGTAMSKALGMTPKLAREASDIGGASAVGRTVLKETGIGAQGLLKAGQTVEEIAPKITAAREGFEKKIANFVEENGGLKKRGEQLGLGGEMSPGAPQGPRVFEPEEIDTFAKKLGGEPGKQLRQDFKTYQQLSLAEKAAAGAIDAAAEGGGAHNALALGAGFMHGGPLGAIGAYAAKKGTEYVAARGNSLAAAVLDRAAQFGAIRQAQQTVSNRIAQSVRRFTIHELGVVRLPHAMPANDRFERAFEHVAQMPDAMPHAVPQLAIHAPLTSTSLSSVTARGSQFLKSKLPTIQKDPTSLQPEHAAPLSRISDSQKLSFMKSYDAVQNPMGVLDDLKAGRLSQESVEALKAVYPKIYAELAQNVRQTVASTEKPIGYDKTVQLGILLGKPTDATMTPSFGATLAQAFVGGHEDKQAHFAAPKHQLEGLSKGLDLMTDKERA